MRKRQNPKGIGQRGHMFGLAPREKRKAVQLSIILGKLRQLRRVNNAQLVIVRKYIQQFKLRMKRTPTRRELIRQFAFLEGKLPNIKR
ncbi:MAG: hypothetical protein IPJ89_01175 [Candidatus Iainarchaeum archaeon]|uniref:Uncharacterized protein n=1 Tax=Candidatus Iainarchaeum sp. TaxID=3101447 RepID=A0A7T9I1B0_9ARCH|nr:MAG: hypothetical protein IPJ89_01175 [Candidatus Diapherotrites archaeon]